MDPDIDFREFMGAFDTVLVGRRTCEATRHLGGAGMPGMQAFVFSRTIRQADCPDVIVSDKPAETLATLKASRGKDIWLFGGGVSLLPSPGVPQRRRGRCDRAPRLPIGLGGLIRKQAQAAGLLHRVPAGVTLTWQR